MWFNCEWSGYHRGEDKQCRGQIMYATFKDKDIYCRHYELTEAFTSTNKPQGFPLDSLNGVNRLLSVRLWGVSGSPEMNPSSIPPQEHIVIRPLLGLSSTRNILMWCIIAGDSICLQELETAGTNDTVKNLTKQI
ncbi:hypothetical protein BDQ17DRAFT_1330950 [Cyathus striatus]|nr:hypothetical protein BDQ17DRAFT_1330950 [Cyathus striatus]